MFRDLTEGIVVGFALGALLFINRMSKAIALEELPALAQPDVADGSPGADALPSDPDFVVYRLSGAFFFGAAAAFGATLDRIADRQKPFVLDFAAVPFLDSTAANMVEQLARKAGKKGIGFWSPVPRRMSGGCS